MFYNVFCVIFVFLSVVLAGSNDTVCSQGYLRCHDGKCILKNLRCDFHNDCLYGEDEFDCGTYHCHPPQFFRCNNDHCVNSSLICNGNDDCNDMSDEINCTLFSNTSTCQKGEFQCLVNSSSKDIHCIPESKHCDGTADCSDGSDEEKCTIVGRKLPEDSAERDDLLSKGFKKEDIKSDLVPIKVDDGKCEPDYFKCGNFTCLPSQMVCDGKTDCFDESDEDPAHCLRSPECSKSEFKCYDELLSSRESTGLRCIPDTWFCDGDVDCSNGSDEENCSESTSSSITKQKSFINGTGNTREKFSSKDSNGKEFLPKKLVKGETQLEIFSKEVKEQFSADIEHKFKIENLELQKKNLELQIKNLELQQENIQFEVELNKKKLVNLNCCACNS